MADWHNNESSSKRNTGESSESTVEINIKTLDSQIYSFHVDKNMPVSAFKEKIAIEIGVPVAQQRLIFRGRVLKDEHPLSEYQVENGHTLHLVARQPVQSQTSTDTSSGETSNDANASAPRNRIGQISHSMVLGTFNVGDPGEGTAADISRVIGAVLNSFGIGGQAGANGIGGMQTSVSTMNPSHGSQGNETGGGNASGQNQAGNQTSSGQAFPGQPFHVRPQVMQVPITGSVPVPLPSVHSPIRDSLSTLSEFMMRMERVLAQNGLQPNASSNSLGDLPRVELPSNARGVRTPEALSIILRQAEQLLSGPATTTLSHMAGLLEQEGSSTDRDTRGQIQMESVNLGIAMQHLGALLLELGRTILTLRMGASPAEASVNPGPSVYISSSGPNPIMVQPFPLQAYSLLGDSVPPATPVPLPIGTTSRNINIHIHAGNPPTPAVATIGTRTSGGEGMQGALANGTGSGSSVPERVRTVRNIIAAAVPSHAPGSAVSIAGQPGASNAVSQSQSDSASLSSLADEINSSLRSLSVGRVENQPASGSVGSGAVTGNVSEQSNSVMTNDPGQSSVALVDEINSQIRSLVASSQGESQPASGSIRTVVGDDTGREQPSSRAMLDAEKSTTALPGVISESDVRNIMDGCVLSSKDISSSTVGCPRGEPSSKSEDASETPNSSKKKDVSEDAKAVPLGLGLGNLDRKRPTKQQQPKSLAKSGNTGPALSGQNPNTGPSGQNLLQSTASGSAGTNWGGLNNASLSLAMPVGGEMDNRSLEAQHLDTQFDATGAMSQVLRSPALNGLLSGVAEQTGVGSPNVLTNMLQQLMQNPQVMNSVSQIAQQVDTQDVGNMLSGLGCGQGGSIDFSRMFQQMMPVVSQVLGGGSATPFPFPTVQAESQPQHNERSTQAQKPDDHKDTQINLQEVAQGIERFDAPGDVFRSVIENAARLNGNDNISDVFDDLAADEDLANDYIQMLQHEISRRLEGHSGQDKC